MNAERSVTRLVFGTLAIAAAVAFLVSGCSEVGFPAVHDMPVPRVDTTLTPDQVKQATDVLTSERDHLNTEAQCSAQPNPPANAAASPPPAAAQNCPSPVAQSVAARTTQTAGAGTKP